MIFVCGLVRLIRCDVLWYPQCVTGGRSTTMMHACAALHLVRSNIVYVQASHMWPSFDTVCYLPVPEM